MNFIRFFLIFLTIIFFGVFAKYENESFILDLSEKQKSKKVSKNGKQKKSKICEELFLEMDKFFVRSRKLRKKLCELEEEFHCYARETLENGTKELRKKLVEKLEKVKLSVRKLNDIRFL